MKSKNGKIKLEKGEIRVGNFFVKDEPEFIKIQDLNAVFTYRIGKTTPAGIWAANMLKQGEGGEKSLLTYIGTLWSIFSPAPDDEYVRALLGAASDCLKRHPEWYGLPEVSDKEDRKIIKEERELATFEEELRNLPDEAPETPSKAE